jgi:hypothetical protein
MTEEEIEIVAEELAKVGGITWYPGREKGTLMRIVSDRYRDRARVAIQALDRFRASQAAQQAQADAAAGKTAELPSPILAPTDAIRPGATVVYRPPGDRRAYSCRVVEIEGGRAYLTPIARGHADWVSIEHLVPSGSDTALVRE